ncbi:carboxylesterase family protein [Hirsutella rhossiliensis]|uniref:Carboxylesterase family domain-containing protein n=2 Tax=Hirsutella rhossiliensis TaxID=111463 RepID=A0A9P8SII4_9HYPO|nr:carboxylesterase family domain-containing protein [Hirsutella rhossiliensis]KAH0962046.1 carboxylesterase family domain-containing protein [Hirsutella rhossiliensis]
MPYAQVPDRFAVATGLRTSWDGIHNATKYPAHCVGYGWDEPGYEVSEDCLYLNVVRAAGVRDTSSLPVAVWLHGGGLFMGGSADKRYNLSFIVEHSVKIGRPIIGVSLNYRLSAFGFLSGREAMESGVTNIGFKDQRLALQWVHENIEAFGGSPDKYLPTTDETTSYSAELSANPELQQATYDQLVRNTSCASHVNRALNVSQVGPWVPVLDHDFLHDYPTNQLRKGNFVKVPLLVGVTTDEGGGFVTDSTNSDEDVREALRAQLISNNTAENVDQLLKELMYLYPNPGDAGSPNLGSQYRRMAAIVGDMTFHFSRRRANFAWFEHGVPSYAYRFNVLVNGAPAPFGSAHFQEVAFVFHNWNGEGYSPANPFGGNDAVYTAKATALSTNMSTAWINFINELDPNGKEDIGLPKNETWPKYDRTAGGGVGRNIVWDLDGAFVEMDDWRAEGINWMIENAMTVFGT